MGRILEIIGPALDLVFPRGCAACDEPIQEAGVALCAKCAKALAATVAPDYCGCCGRDVGPFLVREGRCTECQNKRPHYERLVRIGRYRAVLRDLILTFKYRHAPMLDA